jgi:hypothetical protein
MKPAALVLCLELGLDLRPGAMYQCEPYAEGGEQIEIDCKLHEASIGHEIATEGDDEGLAAKRMYIRRRGLEPVDEPVLCRQPQTSRRRLARSRALCWSGGVLVRGNCSSPC